MRLSRLVTRNFRNLPALDVELDRVVVVVGENRSGKSNFVNALRLVLDPYLPNAERRLSSEDFWEGLGTGIPNYDPMLAHEVIEIGVEMVDFGDDQRILSVVSQGAIVNYSPLTARLTYRWAPDLNRAGVYSDGVYFGSEPSAKRVPQELREEIFVAFVSALRDVETDIRSWRRSPLRSLLDSALAEMTEPELASIETELGRANEEINQLQTISAIGKELSDRMTRAVGARQALHTALRSTPQDASSIIRSMQVYVDGTASRSLGTASLGALNILYFALLQMGFDNKLNALEVSHTIVLAEEPEAHLHPHVQRSIVQSISPDEPTSSLIITTHSPHIASATDARRLLRIASAPEGSVAYAAKAAELLPAEWDDINRYLGATQAELVFSSQVLLVEGYAEEVLIPRLAAEVGIDLDKAGITVCAIHGTHFLSYMKFCAALGIRTAVVTDGDIDDEGHSVGADRARTLMESLQLTGDSEANGIFVGDDTLEIDLYRTAGNAVHIEEVLVELGSARASSRIEAWAGAPTTVDLVKEIGRAGGKGRVAQRLASRGLTVPGYVSRALDYLVSAA